MLSGTHLRPQDEGVAGWNVSLKSSSPPPPLLQWCGCAGLAVRSPPTPHPSYTHQPVDTWMDEYTHTKTQINNCTERKTHEWMSIHKNTHTHEPITAQKEGHTNQWLYWGKIHESLTKDEKHMNQWLYKKKDTWINNYTERRTHESINNYTERQVNQ